MNIYQWNEIRNNIIIRFIMLPFINVRRRYGLKKYLDSKDCKFIKGLSNKYAGEKCFIIGNGPSLRVEDLELIKQETTFAFNRIWSMYKYTDWRPTFYMVTDSNFLKKMDEDDIKTEEIEQCFFADNKVVSKINKENVHCIFKYGKTPIKRYTLVTENLSDDVSHFFSPSQSVIINAFELAFYMGFKEIYLLGVDHTFPVEIDTKGKININENVISHFANDEDKTLFKSSKEALTKSYLTCREYAEINNIKIVNLTRGGKLETFDRDELENVLLKK